MELAKLFKNGRSQAVRLPRKFRFEGDEVCIKRVGSAVVLYAPDSGWRLLNETVGKFTDDFFAGGRGAQGAASKRHSL